MARKPKPPPIPLELTPEGYLLVKDYKYIKYALSSFRYKYRQQKNWVDFYVRHIQELKAKKREVDCYYTKMLEKRQKKADEFKWANDLYELLYKKGK